MSFGNGSFTATTFGHSVKTLHMTVYRETIDTDILFSNYHFLQYHSYYYPCLGGMAEGYMPNARGAYVSR